MESISQGIQNRGGDTETVQQKALRLYRAGQVSHVVGDEYIVRGDNGTYEVNEHKRTCECPSRVYCSHRAAVEIFAAKQNTAAIRQLEAKRAEVRKRGAYRPDTSRNDFIAAALRRMES